MKFVLACLCCGTFALTTTHDATQDFTKTPARWDGKDKELLKEWHEFYKSIEAGTDEMENLMYIDPLAAKEMMKTKDKKPIDQTAFDIYEGFLKRLIASRMGTHWGLDKDKIKKLIEKNYIKITDFSGNSNFVYRGTLVDDQDVVDKEKVSQVLVRVYGYIAPNDVEGNWDRWNEHEVMKSHAEHKRGPILYWSRPTDVANHRLECFHTGSAMVDVRDLSAKPDLMKQAVEALASYHLLKDSEMPPSDGALFSNAAFKSFSQLSYRRVFDDPVKTARVKKMNMKMMDAIGQWLGDEFSSLQNQDHQAWQPCWTHNGAHPGNMLLIKGKLLLIDYDTTAKGYPLVDLAVTVHELALASGVDPEIDVSVYPGFNADIRRLPDKTMPEKPSSFKYKPGYSDMDILKWYADIRGWQMDELKMENLWVHFQLARAIVSVTWFFWGLKKTSSFGTAYEHGSTDYITLAHWYQNSAFSILKEVFATETVSPMVRRLTHWMNDNGITAASLLAQRIENTEPVFIANVGYDHEAKQKGVSYVLPDGTALIIKDAEFNKKMGFKDTDALPLV